MSKIRIAECIISYRKEHKLSQGEFGALLGVSAFAVSKWEREICYPDIFLLPQLSEILNVSLDDMFGK
ncbi:MAG: helix-turn-helix transcriptional regulator [Clostridia bacterium]|nr:helix-turn-helix transcriptional regulator [Clostridia bacterium]